MESQMHYAGFFDSGVGNRRIVECGVSELSVWNGLRPGNRVKVQESYFAVTKSPDYLKGQVYKIDKLRLYKTPNDRVVALLFNAPCLEASWLEKTTE